MQNLQNNVLTTNNFKFDERIIEIFMLQVIDLTYILNVCMKKISVFFYHFIFFFIILYLTII